MAPIARTGSCRRLRRPRSIWPGANHGAGSMAGACTAVAAMRQLTAIDRENDASGERGPHAVPTLGTGQSDSIVRRGSLAWNWEPPMSLGPCGSPA